MSAKNSINWSSTEHNSSVDTKDGWISGQTFKQKKVKYSPINGKAIFEGDIVLGTVEQLQSSSETSPTGIGIVGEQFRWPNATVPYTIDADFPNPDRVTEAIAHWQENTPIRFVERSDETNFVAFVVEDNGCFSSVGMQGGRQVINLCPNCTRGNAIHEIGHTVGLWHEQSREDRDNFIRIDFANINPQAIHNFNQHITDGDDIGPYDYCSIMHYPPSAFPVSPGLITIVALQAGAECMGQREKLSEGDISAIKEMYG
jgi:astacin (peptidase family M12A)